MYRLVRELGIESEETCAWFERYYLEDDHPSDAGLWENGLIVRRDSEASTRLNNAWWDLYEHVGGERDQLPRWATSKGDDGIAQYQQDNNAESLDGLPSLLGDH